MQFELSNQKAKLRNFTPSPELHGDEPEAAGYLAIEVNADSGILAMFSPTLRAHLFTKNGATDNLADAVHEAPNLRYPIDSYKWNGEMVGGEMTIHHGLGGRSDLELPITKVSRFVLQPMEGGTCVVNFTLACHPGEKEFGKLCQMVGKEIELSIEPPASETDLAGGA